MSRQKTPPPLLSAIPAAILLVLAALVVGGVFNSIRPASLPWFQDWSHHVETLAHDAGIPLVFLPEVQAAAAPLDDATDAPDSRPVLLDARAAADYEAAHIPGAFHLAVEDIDAVLPTLPVAATPDAPIIVYCSSIECDDALTLALALVERSFTNVRLYSGGFAEWTAYLDHPAEEAAP